MQQPFMVKNRLGTEGNFLKLIKAIYEKFTGDIRLNGKRPDAFLLRSGITQGYAFLSLVLKIALEVLAWAIRQEKKVYRLERKI